jgi:hypothetical protein
MFSAQPTDSLFPCSRPLTGVLDLHSYCRADPCRTSSSCPRFRSSQGGRTSSSTIIAGINHRAAALNEVLLISLPSIRTANAVRNQRDERQRPRQRQAPGINVMGDAPDIRQIRAAARILLICPDCGQENSEFADTLRGISSYACHGDGCAYSFDLVGPRKDFGRGFTDACKRFYAAFYTMRRSSSRQGVR